MIVTRTEILNDRSFIVTTSDKGLMIECDDKRYSEAWDHEGSGRAYTETDEKIEEIPRIETEEKVVAFNIPIEINK